MQKWKKTIPIHEINEQKGLKRLCASEQVQMKKSIYIVNNHNSGCQRKLTVEILLALAFNHHCRLETK